MKPSPQWLGYPSRCGDMLRPPSGETWKDGVCYQFWVIRRGFEAVETAPTGLRPPSPPTWTPQIWYDMLAPSISGAIGTSL